MNKSKILKPDRLFGDIPRSIELILESIFAAIFGFILSLLDVRDIYGERKVYDIGVAIKYYVLLLTVFLIFRLHRTMTIVNRIIVDYNNEKLVIRYSFIYICPKTIIIPFKSFCFEVSDGWSFVQEFKKVKILRNGKKVAKLISKQNGWKEHIVEDVISTFEGIIEYKKKEAVMPQTGNPSKNLIE